MFSLEHVALGLLGQGDRVDNTQQHSPRPTGHTGPCPTWGLGGLPECPGKRQNQESGSHHVVRLWIWASMPLQALPAGLGVPSTKTPSCPASPRPTPHLFPCPQAAAPVCPDEQTGFLGPEKSHLGAHSPDPEGVAP